MADSDSSKLKSLNPLLKTQTPKVSKYRILGLVGQGQFGQVFCGTHRRTGQIFALKNLDRHRFPTHKFLRELRFLLSLQHPNIVTCYALEHTRTGRYLVMDYCEGGTLRSLMETHSSLDVGQSLKLVADILAGLEHAHSRGIVHCDIKPENILLTAKTTQWVARVSDFGIARLSQELSEETGNTGSPAYMAPERFYGQYSPSSDLYAVGIILFELLVGHRPFSGVPADLMAAHLNQPVKIPDQVPSDLHSCILKALQKLPARRFRTAAEMLQAILAVQAKWEKDPDHALQLSAKRRLFPIAHCHVQRDRLHQLATGRSPIIALTVIDKQVYWATPNTVASSLLPKSMTLNSPIQTLLSYSRGCLAVTSRGIHDLSVRTRADALPVIAQFQTDFIATVEPQGRWIAIAKQNSTEGSELLVMPRNPKKAPKTGLSLSIPPQQILALDSRHLVGLSVGSAQDTIVQVFTRRQTQLGTWRLPLPLDRVIVGTTPYQLLATRAQSDEAETTELILINLKPLRIRRVTVNLAPPLYLGATSWGYVVGNASSQLVLLDWDGAIVGQLDLEGLVGLSAVAPYNTSGLLVAAFDGEQCGLYLLDLRQFEIDLVF